MQKKSLWSANNIDLIIKELRGVRFKYKKATYIINARKQFINNGKINIKEKIDKFNDIGKAREWLVKNVKGLGYKEASHFLRNIGYGEHFAILDRHILENLRSLGVIKEIPISLSHKKYLEIENRMKLFSKKVNIPLSHLDLLFWSKETGEIFK